MGHPWREHDLGLMCFSAADHWQMQFHPGPMVIDGWFHDAAFVEHDNLSGGPISVRLIGVGEYNLQTDPVTPIAVKLETRKSNEMTYLNQEEKLFVSFNAAGQSQTLCLSCARVFPMTPEASFKPWRRSTSTAVTCSKCPRFLSAHLFKNAD